jgi:hypothetical protein|tara:strand:+ start:919 stop:1215 length:297 start_codon:yes stop_codon:yes gene_type:complete
MGLFDLDIEFERDNICLSVGDLLIDNVSSRIGVLVKRDRRISIEDDDIYVWMVYWSKETVGDLIVYGTDLQESNLAVLEEEGLKISIIIDYYELIKRK